MTSPKINQNFVNNSIISIGNGSPSLGTRRYERDSPLLRIQVCSASRDTRLAYYRKQKDDLLALYRQIFDAIIADAGRDNIQCKISVGLGKPWLNNPRTETPFGVFEEKDQSFTAADCDEFYTKFVSAIVRDYQQLVAMEEEKFRKLEDDIWKDFRECVNSILNPPEGPLLI